MPRAERQRGSSVKESTEGSRWWSKTKRLRRDVPRDTTPTPTPASRCATYTAECEAHFMQESPSSDRGRFEKRPNDRLLLVLGFYVFQALARRYRERARYLKLIYKSSIGNFRRRGRYHRARLCHGDKNTRDAERSLDEIFSVNILSRRDFLYKRIHVRGHGESSRTRELVGDEVLNTRFQITQLSRYCQYR